MVAPRLMLQTTGRRMAARATTLLRARAPVAVAGLLLSGAPATMVAAPAGAMTGAATMGATATTAATTTTAAAATTHPIAPGPMAANAIDDQSGLPVPATDTLSLARPIAVARAWQALSFRPAVTVTDATFGHTLYVKVFPYDARGDYLGRSSGWMILDEQPFVFALPPGTARVRYEVKYLSAARIHPDDQRQWVTIAPAPRPSPSHYYRLKAQRMAPEFTIPHLGYSQATVWVDGHLWTSSPSDDNEIGGPPAKANGSMRVWSIDWRTHRATLRHTFRHNFGHLNAWGFSALNHDLIVGNGGTDDTLAPRFYVVPVSQIKLDGTNTLASTKAITYTVPADWGNRPGLTWTGQRNVAVMDTDNATTIRTLRLATGATHGRYGTFQTAGPGRYNGTYDLLDTYHLDDMLLGSIYPLEPSQPDQNPVWIDGRLVIPMGDGIGGADSMGMAVVRLGAHGRFSFTIHYDPDNDAQFQGFFYDARDGYMGGITDNKPLNGLFVWHSDNWTWLPR